MNEAGRKRRRFLMAAAAAAVAACGADRRNGLSRGDAFPAITLSDLEGRPHDIGSMPGRSLLVNLWATWCEPCRREMPALDRLAREQAVRGLDVLTVCLDDDPNLVREFLLRYRIDLPVLLDPNQQATKHILSGTALPRSYLVSKDRRVLNVIEGFRDWESPAVMAEMAGLFG